MAVFPLIIPVLHGFFLPGRSLRVFPAMQADVSIPLEIIIPRLQAWLFSLAILALLRQAIHVTIIYCHDASDFVPRAFAGFRIAWGPEKALGKKSDASWQ